MRFCDRALLQSILGVLSLVFGIYGSAFAEDFDFVAPGLTLEKTTTQDAALHPMPLSAIKRVSNNLVIESKTDVGGVRTNYLYRVSESTSLEKTVRFYQELLRDQGRLEFKCEQRNCGSSNHWANDIFGNRNLAGRDSNQSYFVGRLDDGVHQGWLSIYAVQNVRSISYIYLSFIPAPPEDYIADAKRGVLLNESGLSKDWASALGGYLQTNSAAKLLVLGFSKPLQGGEKLEVTMTQASVFAQKMVDLSVQSIGVDKSRIEARPMGLLGQRPLGFEGEKWAYLYLVE